MMPRTRRSRSLWAGLILAAVPAAAALVASGVERPWIPQSPAYRQAGAADAPAVLVEFGDFQCPPCAAAAPLVRQMETQYGPKLRVIFKYRPWFDMHKWAKSAALAAECAGKQGKFWPMYDTLFAKQGDWAESEDATKKFEEYVRPLGLDLSVYRQCVQDPSTLAAIQADVKEADEHWINATPTFFVDGRRMVGGKQLQIYGSSEIERKIGG